MYLFYILKIFILKIKYNKKLLFILFIIFYKNAFITMFY